MKSESPSLTQLYLGEHIEELKALVERNEEKYKKAYFLKVLENPNPLEERLRRLEPLELVKPILAEVKNIREPYQLDKRLLNAWAEIRVADQLRKEGFTNIQKVDKTADFIADKQLHKYAIQVRRIDISLDSRIEKLNQDAKRTGGKVRSACLYDTTIEELQFNFETPLYDLFLGAINEKSEKFKKWKATEGKRCVAIVNNDQSLLLSDNIVRHIGCQQVAKIIQELTLNQGLYFEELIWLPDLSNGAWFTMNPLHCLCDWQDEPLPYARDHEIVARKDVNLNSPISE